jgi:hypothetical protein
MDEEIKRLEDAANSLIEYFDSVQIFATRHEPTKGGTLDVKFGLGNWLARRGQVSDWLIKNEEQTRVEVREHQ